MTDADRASPAPSPAQTEPSGTGTPRRLRRGFLILAVLVTAGLLALDYAVRATAIVSDGEPMVRAAWDLAVLATFLLTAALLGRLFLRALRLEVAELYRRLVLSWALGFVVLYVVATVLATVQLVRWWTLAPLIFVPPLVWRREARAVLADVARVVKRPRTGERAWGPVFSVLAALLGLTYLALAISPPSFIDPVTYHIVIPADTLEHGGVPPDKGNFFRSFPPAMSMLYMILMSVGSDVLPKMLHGFFLLLTLFALRSFLEPVSGLRVARYATLLFAAQWSVHHAVQRANVDFHFAFYGVTSFLVLAVALVGDDEAKDEPAPSVAMRWVVLAGLLLGAAVSSKLQALNAVAGSELLLLFLLWRRRIGWREIAVFHVAAGLVYLPTFARNLIYPTDPLLLAGAGIAERFLPFLPLDPDQVESFRAMAGNKRLFMTEVTPVTFLLTPIFAYVDGRFPSTNFDAFIDPLYLVSLPLCLFFLRGFRFLQATYVYLFGFYICWIFTAPLTRYAFPILPLLCWLSAYGFFRLAGLHARLASRLERAVAALLLTVVGVSWLGLATTYEASRASLGPAVFLGQVERGEYLEATQSHALPSLVLGNRIRRMEAMLPTPPPPDRSKVFMVFESQSYYLGKQYLNDPFYVNLVLLRDRQRAGVDPIEWLRSHGYLYVLTDFGRVPWIQNRNRRNRLLNPYPDALAAFDELLDWWRQELEPRLQSVTSFATRDLYVVPGGDDQPAPALRPGPPVAPAEPGS